MLIIVVVGVIILSPFIFLSEAAIFTAVHELLSLIISGITIIGIPYFIAQFGIKKASDETYRYKGKYIPNWVEKLIIILIALLVFGIGLWITILGVIDSWTLEIVSEYFNYGTIFQIKIFAVILLILLIGGGYFYYKERQK